ncbi:MAG: transpeptidase family protein [Muribaculaceae bacterium]|nr:transpeptidase family protein [Muribaculaceae bacterium]
MAKKGSNKRRIFIRYGVITSFFLLMAMGIVWNMFRTTVVEASEWNERAEKQLSKIDTIAPERGSILASNGNILACNVKVCDIKIDMRHNKIMSMPKSKLTAKLDSLADTLDILYPRFDPKKDDAKTREEKSWRTRFHAEIEKNPGDRTRSLTIARHRPLEEFDSARKLAFIRDFKGAGFRCPLYKEEHSRRIYPYGKMANRSIGRVHEVVTPATRHKGEIHGYSGLEKDLDSLLYGKPGYAKLVPLTKGYGNWVTTPPTPGYDLLTTINIDLQDIVEESLQDICSEHNCEWGTAILMEVSTGEIVALSSIERLDDGSYGEARNRAVLPFEPGSVIKPISMMIAFEDGLVTSVNQTVDCSPFQRTHDPHAPGVKTMKQVIEMSSNTGIARVIFKGYASDPAKYHDRLASIGFFDPINSGIAGEQVPQVRRLEPTNSKGLPITLASRHLDLARQAYGYNTMIPPLYTLAYYNAIANKGRLVRPHLVRALRSEKGDSIIPISYIRDRICSPETAEKVKQCIHEVVWGDHGTARLVRDDRVKIVGKTGTAFPVENGQYNAAKRRFAFAGFFPYEQPKYSCMVLVQGAGGLSANRTSGQVMKQIALKMHARGMLSDTPRLAKTDTGERPTVAASMGNDAEHVANALGHPVKKVAAKNDFAAGKVPDVTGYDLRSAIKLLESRGLNVAVQGAGRVTRQSLQPGSKAIRGQKITLTLAI